MKCLTLNNVSKEFSLKVKAKDSTLGRILDFWKHSRKTKKILAVRDVSLNIDQGETLGIIGLNGSGKSTLLRLMADIYRPTSGSIWVSGRIISIIGLSLRIEPRLSMLDNIFITCSLYGLDRTTIKSQVKAIAQFAELEDYLNTPLYQFSSGMISRLLFSIAIHSILNSKARILLLDEVFAVGDIEFVKKSFSKLKEILKGELTVVITGHNLDAMAENCNRVIWLDEGKIIKDGKSQEVIAEYKKHAEHLT
ncbi:MAG: ATP-binding cassette domain-containing protein [Patescibacteria group bacterium]|jgi:ABC-type polysaccharide/polyol phosphate transport system ATPase subunit